ncbi:MAG TPA: DUF3276 family protein [Rectinemataceae bacterium]|nr:DUF3276 family protein [Rectinemataceae bacterium]
MGIRGELFSTRFACDGRTYFFNVKQNRNGDVFLSIVESKPSEGESFDRRSIVVFGEHMEEFLKSFQSALKFIDKTGIKVAPDPTAYNRADEDDEGKRPARRSSEPRQRREFDSPREGRSSSYREHGDSDHKPARRAVVRAGGPSGRTSSPSDRTGAPSGRTFTASPRSGASASRTFTASPRSGAPSGRSGASSGKPLSSAGRYTERPGSKGPATGPRNADKPVKRIVVRKVKKSDSTD